MQFPYKSIQTAYYYKENPLSAYLKAKTSQVYRKNTLPKANFRYIRNFFFRLVVAVCGKLYDRGGRIWSSARRGGLHVSQ